MKINFNKMNIRKFILAIAILLPLGMTGMQAQEKSQTDSLDAYPVEHHFSLYTNLFDWGHFGTMNLSAMYSVSRRSSLGATVRWNPFEWGNDQDAKLYKMRAFELDYRWWPWHVYSGWWLTANAQVREYNVANVWGKDYNEQGWAVGAGLGFGYTYMLNDHWNIEAGASAWAGYKDYKKYECPECGMLIKKGSKSFVEPDRVFINIVYVF